MLQETVMGQVGNDVEALWVEVDRVRDIVEKNDETLKSEINRVLLKIDELFGEAKKASEKASKEARIAAEKSAQEKIDSIQEKIDLILQM